MINYEINDLVGYKDYSYLDDVIKRTLKHEKIDNCVFSIIFVDEKEIQRINKEYRNIDRVTDVISFAFEDNSKIVYNTRQLGEIFISIPKMLSQAEEYGHSYKRELAFLTVHGILHLLGYDHTKSKEDEKIMFERQEVILNEFQETRKC